MTGGRRKTPMNVRLNRNGKTLNFSSRASIPFAGYTDAEVFEKDGVIAVCGAVNGNYHISGEAGRPRKVLSNAQLVEYIGKKFHCQLGTCLPAWLGEQENVLFFGGMQTRQSAEYVLDDSYTPVEVEYNRREGDWAYVHDNWIEFTREVRENLPPRMSAFRCGNVVVLVGDAVGALSLTAKRQKGTQMLVSHELADYLRGLYGGVERGMRLRAAILPGGVALADEMQTLTAANLTKMSRIMLEEGKRCFLTCMKKTGFYLSVPAWEKMERGQGWEVYGDDTYLALRAEPQGALQVVTSGYAHYIHNSRLCDIVKVRWPGVNRLHLLRHGDMWLLWPGASKPVLLPPASAFRRIDLSAPPQKEARTRVHAADTRVNVSGASYGR